MITATNRVGTLMKEARNSLTNPDKARSLPGGCQIRTGHVELKEPTYNRIKSGQAGQDENEGVVSTNQMVHRPDQVIFLEAG